MPEHLNVSRDQIIRRISGEYLEMPGLRLTTEQAQRLWGLDQQSCCDILAELVATSFLIRTADGRYARPSEDVVRFPPARMARAALAPAKPTREARARKR
jgi:hypothetical protein